MADRIPVVDADGHILERQSDIRKYLAPQWNERKTDLWARDQPWDVELSGKLTGYPELRGEVEAPLLSKKPSDIVRESPIYFSVEASESFLPQVIDFIGDEHFVYASDIPHWDGQFPGNLDGIRNHRGLSRETKEKVLYHNSRALFGLKAPTAAASAQ